MAGLYRAPPAFKEPSTLVGTLVPVADRLRQLLADTGVRIYRVWMVHAYWTGGARGKGDRVVGSGVEIQPMPRVRDLNAVRRNLTATGVTAEGDIIIDQISARYTEDDLMGRTPDRIDPNTPRTSMGGTEFWYEVQENRPSTPPPVIHRFSPPVAIPMLSRGGLAWTIVLTKQGEDRGRRGGEPLVNSQ